MKLFEALAMIAEEEAKGLAAYAGQVQVLGARLGWEDCEFDEDGEEQDMGAYIETYASIMLTDGRLAAVSMRSMMKSEPPDLVEAERWICEFAATL